MRKTNKAKAPKQVGRKTKKTSKYIEPLLDNLRSGMTYQAAATQAGLSQATVDKWRQSDDEFSQKFNEAVDYAEAVLLSELRAQGRAREDWRSTAWILERRFPERWGLKKEIDMNVTDKKADGQEMVLAMIAQATEALKAPATIDESEIDNDD